MITLSDKFKNDTSSVNNFLIPLVILEWASGEKIHISTNEMMFDGEHYSPLLRQIPSLTESIGIQSKNYKISSLTLKISNYKYGDTHFSDLLTDSTGDYLIGGTCKIYYKSQSVMILDDCLQIYLGTVREIKLSSENVDVRLEDLSQELFYKDIPITKNDSNEEILDEYKNAPYPMVYGFVDKSPCIIGDRSITDVDQQKSTQVIAESNPDVMILNNLDDVVFNTTIYGTEFGGSTYTPPNAGDNRPYETAESYLMLFAGGKYASINRETYDEGIIGAVEVAEDEDGEYYTNSFLPGEQTNVPNDSSNKNIVLLKAREGSENRRNLIAENKAECFFVQNVRDVKSWGEDDYFEYEVNNNFTMYRSYTPAPLPFSGSAQLYCERPDYVGDSWHTAIKHTFVVISPPAKVNYRRNSSIKHGYLKGRIIFTAMSDEHPDALFGLWGNVAYPSSAFGEIGSYYDFYEELEGKTSTWGSGYPHDTLGDSDANSNSAGLIVLDQVYDIDRYTFNTCVTPTLEDYKPTDTDIWSHILFLQQWGVSELNPNSFSTTSTLTVGTLELDFKAISLYHVGEITDKKLFCKIIGRSGLDGSLSPPSVIVDIIQSEVLGGGTLNYDTDEYTIAIDAHLGWEFAFTIFERENSKKIIERIIKETKSFMFVNNLSNFSFVTILDKYEVYSYTGEEVTFADVGNVAIAAKGHFIDNSDIIKFKIKRTRLRDVVTKLELLYHYDYGHKNHLKTTADLDIEQTATELFGAEYKNSYYGLSEEQGDSPVELNFIRQDYAAVELHRYLLAQNCNQHNIFSLRLPLSYLKHEIGDIIAFKELIEGRKAYGEDYSFRKRTATLPDGTADEQVVIRNGQEIHPFFMITKTKKTLDYVDIEAIQLHNLTNIPTEAVNTAPTARLTFELTDDGMNSPPDVYDAVVGYPPVIWLDGAGSTDPEGDTLSYDWHYDSALWLRTYHLDSTVRLEFTGTLPTAVGAEQIHDFSLTVDDGQYSHTSNFVRIYIIHSDANLTITTQDYSAGWNLVSLPLSTAYDVPYHLLFPDAIPGTLFGFDGTYVQAAVLEPGKGYWLRFDEPVTNTFIGYPVNSITINLTEGWNLIGGVTEEALLENIDDPNDIIASNTLYGFNDTYEAVDILKPGKGYWIRAIQTGDITINA